MRTVEYDYYKILGITPQATPEIVRKAFERLTAEMPEGLQTAENPQYQRLLNAYEVLSDFERRTIYDSLLAETAPDSLKINVQASTEKVAILDTSQLFYLLIDVRPPEQEVKANLPLNLSLIIDRSTSMQGARLDRVKAAVNLIIDQLSPDDILSVISFSDRAEVVLPASNIQNKSALITKIRNIRASGGTEIYQGLSAGVGQLRQVALNKHMNHVILLTDGHTYGDAEKCLQLAQETAAQKIGFSAFGIGSEWNDEFLDQLVAPSGGRSDFIEKPEEIIGYLEDRINGLGDVYAQNVRLLLQFPQAINLQYSFKLMPFAQPLHPDRTEIKLGDIQGRAPLAFLLELSLQPQSMETRINIPLTLVADIPSHQLQERVFKQDFQLYILSELSEMEPSPVLLKAVRMLNMYRMSEKVWHEVEAGNMEMATQRMRYLSTRLLEAGETQLAHQAHAETERLASVGDLSAEGRKRLKYGTRALMTRTFDLDSEL